MSRSFYVDSLIVKDAARPVVVPSLPEPPPPPPGQDFLIPLGVPAPLVMSVAGGPACPSRKSGGTFCVCPLCVTSHLHASARAGGGGGGAAAASLPLLKGHFAPGGGGGAGPGGEGQFCPRMSHVQQPTAPQQQQQPPPGSVASAAAAAQALAHPPVCAAAAYGMSDPRRFHCLGLGRSCCPRALGGREGGRVDDLRWFSSFGTRRLMPPALSEGSRLPPPLPPPRGAA